MIPHKEVDWRAENQRRLMGEVRRLQHSLERHVGGAGAAPTLPAGEEVEPRAEADPSAALDALARTFDLSPFELDVLLLTAGPELDASFAGLCAKAQGDAERPYPTFSLALAALDGAHWSALSPSAPLRRWLLVEIGPGNSLTSSPLRIDETILHYLVGLECSDERLAGLDEPVDPGPDLVPSHRQVAERMATTWRHTAGTPEFPAIQLCGRDSASKRSIAAAGCALLGLSVRRAQPDALPRGAADLDRLVRLWERSSLLSSRALLLDCDEVDPGEGDRNGLISRVIEGYDGPLIVTTRKRRPPKERPFLVLETTKPTRAEQREVWTGLLGEGSEEQSARLAAQFNFNLPTLHAAYAGSLGRIDGGEEEPGGREKALRHVCRDQVRPRMADLAEHIVPGARRSDLVLPAERLAALDEIAGQVREQATVYDRWGFGESGSRGLGVSVLFSGPSGTGKTMAAEVLARELDLDLFRIDLASVVSKYIGETEKNLARLFDAAEEGGAILLFDEADALFGKRTEIKDSHDRFANVEISYLLQRIESYDGLAILTSNMRDAIDAAFLRRLRFIVDFPFPDRAARALIWRRVFPSALETATLDFDRLARLNLSGGNIRNVALNAAFLAADEDEGPVPVGMVHLRRAAHRELLKIRKTSADGEFRNWEVGDEA